MGDCLTQVNETTKNSRKSTGVVSIEKVEDWSAKSNLRQIVFEQRREVVKLVPSDTDIVVITETKEMNPRVEFEISDDGAKIVGKYNMAMPHRIPMPLGMVPTLMIPLSIDDSVSNRLEKLKAEKLTELLQFETILRQAGKINSADFAKKLQSIIKSVDWNWERLVWAGSEKYALKFASVNAYCEYAKPEEANNYDPFDRTLGAMQVNLKEIGSKMGFEPKKGVKVLKVFTDTDHLFHSPLMPYDERSKLWIQAHRKV